MNSIKQQGRLAGLLWFLTALTGAFGLLYIRSKVLVPGDASATAAHIIASEFLFRAAIVSTLFSQLFMFFFGLALFRLFKDVHKQWATVLLISIMMTVAIAVVNTLNLFGALVVLGPADYLKPFTPEQLNAVAMFFLRMGNSFGQGLLEIFWTPYFFAFGLLIIKSRFLPKILGILLMIMSVGYAINVFTKFLVPQFYPGFFTQLAMSLGALGGLPTIFWLLIFGAKDQPSGAPRSDRAIAY
jgi:hypothetical protein